MLSRFFIVAIVLTGWRAAAAELTEAQQRDHQILSEAGIEASATGALKHLESLIPIGDPNATLDALIHQLGDDAFERREDAAVKLLNFPVAPRAKLEQALGSEDAEIRWRARIVLGRLGSTGNRALLTALREIARDPPERALEVLLRFAAMESSDAQQHAVHKAIRGVAKADDLPQLKKASAAGLAFARLAAAQALLPLDDEAGRAALVGLLEEAHPRIVLTAARHLGNHGDRRALIALARLAASDEPFVANESVNFLSALADRDFGFLSLADSAARKKVTEEVQRWVAEEGPTAKLRFPVAEPVLVRGDLNGNTLVATGGVGRVVELDPTGREVFRYDIVAWGAEKLTNGNVLIASYQTNMILEVNRKGAVVWNHSGINAMRAKPLADGHILVADFGGNRVLELSEDRQIVWQSKTPESCFDADRLPDGHTVYACPNVIREIDAEGQAIRELALEGRANSIQVLPNGNWLVANFGKNSVQEYDRSGKLVWSFDEPTPSDAYRLKSGKTLITSSRRCIELAEDGKTTRVLSEAKYGCARQ